MLLPLESPALTRQLLRGLPAGHAAQGPLADLAERFEFFAEHQQLGTLPAAQRDELFERQQVAVARQAEARASRQQAARVEVRFKRIVARVSVVVLVVLLGLAVLG